jgi:hypothetical protein
VGFFEREKKDCLSIAENEQTEALSPVARREAELFLLKSEEANTPPSLGAEKGRKG